MRRCLELARLGAGHVAPNPMVGAVLVYDDRIIGEGWHQRYGQAHAEVNCLGSVKEEDRELIPRSALYVSLEPCAHYGKTPPCSDLIIAHKIPKVIIGCSDPFESVNGKGTARLREAGIDVAISEGRLHRDCIDLNKRFFTYHLRKRPYIILKWAQTDDGFIAPHTPRLESQGEASDRLLISNQYANRLVHRWRSEEAAILVGTNTAMNDDPQLNNRLWTGPSPIRLVIDKALRLSPALKLFNGHPATIVFNEKKHTLPENTDAAFLKNEHGTWYYKINKTGGWLNGIVDALYRLKIQSVLVEGGAALLHSFTKEGVWDEIRTITNENMTAGAGLAVQRPAGTRLIDSFTLTTDRIDTWLSSATTDEH